MARIEKTSTKPDIDQALLREILEALLGYVYTELDFDRDEKEYFKDLLIRLGAWPSKDRQD